VRAPEPIPGFRIVAEPAVLDGLGLASDAVALRLAPDELFVTGASMDVGSGLVEEERGFVGWWLEPDELDRVAHRVEWPLPGERPALAQGLVAGVPARLWLGEGRILLLVAAAYAHELVDRLP
jgi:hypothetical protein